MLTDTHAHLDDPAAVPGRARAMAEREADAPGDVEALRPLAAPPSQPALFVRRLEVEPAYVAHRVARIAELKGLSAGEVEAAVTANAARLFGFA